jgi:3',5'-cyclic AMP phosphodiesterase CpdA
VEDLERLGAVGDIGLVVVTGDFTTRGDWSDATRGSILQEFQELMKALRISRDDIVCVPGNHDIVRFPEGASVDVAELAVKNQTTMQHERDYRTFLEELTGRSWRSPLNYVHRVQLGERRVALCVLNSCTITATQWTEYGYVGTSGLDALNQMSADDEPGSSLKIVALHHHVVPVASIEAPNAKGVSLTLDSVALLDAALNNGAHLILHGHQHQARLTTYGRLAMNGESETRGLIIVSGGSTGATAQRLPGSERNTYSLLSLSQDGVQLAMRELRPDARAGATLYRGRLPHCDGV